MYRSVQQRPRFGQKTETPIGPNGVTGKVEHGVVWLNSSTCTIAIIRPRRSRSAAAYSDQTFPWTICRLVRRSVQCIVEKRRIGSVGHLALCRTGPGMRQVVGFGERSTGRGTFGGEFGARYCNQWELYGVRVRQCRDAALFPNYFGQICYLSHCCHETDYKIVFACVCLSVCTLTVSLLDRISRNVAQM